MLKTVKINERGQSLCLILKSAVQEVNHTFVYNMVMQWDIMQRDRYQAVLAGRDIIVHIEMIIVHRWTPTWYSWLTANKDHRPARTTQQDSTYQAVGKLSNIRRYHAPCHMVCMNKIMAIHNLGKRRKGIDRSISLGPPANHQIIIVHHCNDRYKNQCMIIPLSICNHLLVAS